MLPLLDDAARPDLRSLGFSELSALVSRLGEQPYRARQLYSWLHRKVAASLAAMTDLPRAFRELLHAGRMRSGLRHLHDRDDGTRAQPDRWGNLRPGLSRQRRPATPRRTGRAAADEPRLHGNGGAAAQLRQRDAVARAAPQRRGGE